MKWNKEPPSKTGWYWLKQDKEISVVFCNGCFDENGKWRWYQKENFTKKCLWSGPIKKPDGMKEDSKPISRPRVNISRELVVFIRSKGLSLNQVAMNLGIGKATVRRILKEG